MPSRNFRELHDKLIVDPGRAEKLEQSRQRMQEELAA